MAMKNGELRDKSTVCIVIMFFLLAVAAYTQAEATSPSEKTASGATRGEGSARSTVLRVYGGYGITPVGAVVTFLNNEGLAGGAFFGATLFLGKLSNGALMGIDASYLPLLTTSGSYGSAKVFAIPILLTINSNVATGVGISLVNSSGTLVSSEGEWSVNFTTAFSYMYSFGTPGLFLGVKTVEIVYFNPISADISVGIILGVNL